MSIANLAQVIENAERPEYDGIRRVVDQALAVQPLVVELTGPATFAAGDETYVLRRGLIFRAGRYDDKDFEVTREELARAARTAKFPIPVDLEHRSTVLDSKLGELRGVELSADGTDLYGLYAEPTWLNRLLGPGARKVSCTWDRATKSLMGLALVNNPRVEDAVLMAAFDAAKPHTKEGPTMADEELDPVLARLKAMTPDDRKAALARLEAPAESTPPAATPEASPPAETAGFSAEAAQLRAEVDALKAERRLERAASFAEKMATDGRIAVHEKPLAQAAMFNALHADESGDQAVQFSADGKSVASTNEALVRAIYAARQPRPFGPRIAERDEPATFGLGEKGESPEEYARRVNAKYDGRNRVAGSAS